MKQIYSIQAARGIAAWMVVAFHMRFIEGKYISAAILPDIFSYGMLGVDVFFVISGFVMVHATAGMRRGIFPSFQFLWRRVVRVYPPYWFYSALLLPVLAVAPSMINAAQGGEVSLLHSFLLLPDDKLPLLPVGWSLIFEMWFYLVFAILLLAPPRMMPVFLIMWSGGVVFGSGTDGLSPAGQLVTSPYTLEFIAGCVGASTFRYISVKSAAASIALGVLGISVVFAVVPETHEAVTIWRCVSVGGCVALVLSGAAALERDGVLAIDRWFRWTGDISYSLYLSHILVLSVLGRLWFAVIGGAGYGASGVAAFWVAAVVAVALCAHFSFRYLERPILGLFRRPQAGARLAPGSQQTS